MSKGFRDDGAKRIKHSIGFDAEMFDKINEIAAKHKLSFGDVVRQLCKKSIFVYRVFE